MKPGATKATNKSAEAQCSHFRAPGAAAAAAQCRKTELVTKFLAVQVGE